MVISVHLFTFIYVCLCFIVYACTVKHVRVFDRFDYSARILRGYYVRER